MLGLLAFGFLVVVFGLCILANVVKNDDETDEANANNVLFRRSRMK